MFEPNQHVTELRMSRIKRSKLFVLHLLQSGRMILCLQAKKYRTPNKQVIKIKS